MSDNNKLSWLEFQSRAVESLLYEAADFLYRYQPVIRLSVDPAFNNSYSWHIVEQRPAYPPGGNSDSAYFVYYKVWRKDLDYPDLDSPDYTGPEPDEPNYREYVESVLPDLPTLEVQEFEISKSIINGYLEKFTKISVPISPSKPYSGWDGEMTTIRIGEDFQRATFEWWCEGPPEWRALTTLASKLLEHLSQEFIRNDGRERETT